MVIDLENERGEKFMCDHNNLSDSDSTQISSESNINLDEDAPAPDSEYNVFPTPSSRNDPVQVETGKTPVPIDNNKYFISSVFVSLRVITGLVGFVCKHNKSTIDKFIKKDETNDKNWPILSEDTEFSQDFFTVQAALNDRHLSADDDLVRFFQKYYGYGSLGLTMILKKLF